MSRRYTIKKFYKDILTYSKNYANTIHKGLKMEIINPPLGATLFDMTKPETIKEFELISDFSFGGKSWGNLSTSKHGRAVFHGTTSTDIPENTDIHQSGFVGIRSYPKIGLFNRIEIKDIEWYDCVELKYRGDGRGYFLNLQSTLPLMDHKYELYQSFLYTKGGPYWEIERIPFSKFIRTFMGTLQEEQFEFSRLKTFGISISDKKSGPFRLEIESIKLLRIGSQPPTFKSFDHPRFQRGGLVEDEFKPIWLPRKLTDEEEADRRRRVKLPPLPPKNKKLE